MTTEDKTNPPDGMSEATDKSEHEADAASTETRQDEQSKPSFSAVLELEGKRIDPKEWASHILNVNIAMAVLAQDPPAFENRLRETMSPDASEWGEAMDGFKSSKVYLESVAAVLDAAHMRVLFTLGRIAGVDEDEDADPAGPDGSRTKIQRLYRQTLDAHEQMDRSDDSESDGSWRRYDVLRAQIMRTPSTCPRDVAIKLRLYASMNVVDHPEDLPEEGENDVGYLRTAICDLERLASEKDEGTAASGASDPVAQIGRDLASIWRRHDRNEEEQLQIKKPCLERTRLEQQAALLSDRADALQNMAPEILATSLEGAMVQIILADGAANLMGGANLGLTVEQTTTALVKDIHKLLNSALAVLEQKTGVPREELGGETYMARSFDPHVVIAETA